MPPILGQQSPIDGVPCVGSREEVILHSIWSMIQTFPEYPEVDPRGTAFCMSDCASLSDEMQKALFAMLELVYCFHTAKQKIWA